MAKPLGALLIPGGTAVALGMSRDELFASVLPQAG